MVVIVVLLRDKDEVHMVVVMIMEVKDSEGGKIDFKQVNSGKNSDGDGSNKTFSHTEYCQACPLCGVEKKNEKWERKEDINQCPHINLYKPRDEKGGTLINFLYSGDETNEIAKNLKAFCNQTSGSSGVAGGSGASDSQKLYQKWTCYEIDELTKDQGGVEDEVYNNGVQTGGGLCILKNNINKKEKPERSSQMEPADIQKTFNPFFYYWVVHMLKDSIHWRTKKLDKCINNSNESKACKNNNKCNRECGCFQKWVAQKKEEWDAIKKHFKTQDIRGTGGTFDKSSRGLWE
ncbi:hypothetical protein PFNF135_06260 [Plasmodium falciparum NF135/5.C10]|uniref:Duffy-binding-like domain-containing protein n=1 Tax=Plasmodium falciparum NF135/5.C10 TaxID=1036726 RepID=W4I898_PLAFA|nr:hypothetical protein PFNF135_06260 [Plasmodium falciparum NF135/5.C10]